MMIWNNLDMWVTDHSTIFNSKITSLCSNKSSLFQLPPFPNLPIGPESLSSVPPGAVADTGATGNDGSCQNDCQENDGSNSMEIHGNESMETYGNMFLPTWGSFSDSSFFNSLLWGVEGT